jgi:sarcosine oxidase subunit gamma
MTRKESGKMSDSAKLRHGLEPFLSSRTDQSGSGEGISIEVQTDLGHINLRGDAANSEFLAAVATALQQELPVAANTMTSGDHRVFWLGPNEWQIVTAADNTARLLAGLREALTDVHASMCDLSGGQVALRVTGSGVRQVLAKGCTLDLSPAKFAVGACAQSGLAKAGMLIGCIDDAGPVFEIIVRRSFADYVARWLHHAAAL